ncbi:MAG: FAD-binding protein [Chloroflexia bacterium]|nr:FAD-binding protein [Chloroflexia bacterium]
MARTDTSARLQIDGVSPAATATPESAEELATVLGRAAVDGATVVPVGGATSLGLGNVPDRVDLALHVGGLSHVLAYEPADLTLSVEAGATITSIQATLGEHGQELPIEVPFPDRATIGGVVATGFAGPRRLGDGTLRDLLIGASVARTDGTLSKSGGMVVKNVSGFDLARLMHGALGTLGVLTSVNLKVLPAAKADRTLLIDGDLGKQTRAALAACRFPLRPTSIEIVLTGAGSRLAFRLRGTTSGVDEQTRELRSFFGVEGLEVCEQLDGAVSVSWWQHLLDHWGGEPSDRAQLFVRVRPRRAAELLCLLREAVGSGDEGDEAICAPGLGFARLRLPVLVSEPGLWLRSTQARWLGATDDVVFESAPADAKRGVDVWGRSPAALSVMRTLKHELDPSGALNRGRYVDFL